MYTDQEFIRWLKTQEVGFIRFMYRIYRLIHEFQENSRGPILVKITASTAGTEVAQKIKLANKKKVKRISNEEIIDFWNHLGKHGLSGIKSARRD